MNATVWEITPTSPRDYDNIRYCVRDNVQAGDTVLLVEAGPYTEASSIELNKNVVIMAKEGVTPVVQLANGAYFKMMNDANTKIIGLKFDGATNSTQYGIRPYDASKSSIIIEDCEFYGFTKNIITCDGANHADSVIIDKCYFHDNTRAAVYFATSNDAGGSNCCDKVKVTNTTIANISALSGAGAIDIRNNENNVEGATSVLFVDHCTFYNILGYERIVHSLKSPLVTISNCVFSQPETATNYATWAYGGEVSNCIIYNLAGHHDWSPCPTFTSCSVADPKFKDAANGDYGFSEDSPALTAASDGGAIGDPRWVPSVAPVEPLMKTIYCKMDKAWWKADGAAVGVYTWDDGGNAKAAWPGERMTPVEGEADLWSVELDINTYHMCIFTRVNGEGDVADWGAKTGDLTIPIDEKDLYTITSESAVWGDPGVAGEWSKYEPSAPVVLDAPAAAPADPTLEAYQVKAVYSAKYSADCSFGEWSSGTQYKQEEFGKKYVTTEKGYFGLEFTHTDCSEMEALHLDAWIAEDASFHVVPIHGGAEVGVTVNLKGQQWNSIDIDLSKFEGVTDWSNVYQIKIDEAANLTFWLNNVYFYTTQTKTIDLVDGYYLIGTMNSWDLHNVTAADKFAVNPANEKEYVLTTTLAENDEFKVVEVANNAIVTGKWFPAEAGNYVVDFAHAGENKDIYFRPDYEGGEGWYANCIYVAESTDNNPWESWFAIGDSWTPETESYLEWDAENEKATVHIAIDKNGQWRAQVKYHGPIAEEGKWYRVALKMKANNAIQNVTVKYQDNKEMIYVNDIALENDVEFVFDQKGAGIADGNGIMVLDFGFAKAGDVIEIYDVVIEETEAPEQVLADGYYLIGTIGGVSGWTVADVKAENKFEQNPENNAEYMLNVTLAEGDELQVVNVINDKISGDWFPGGEGNNYIVDADHAGEVTIYFRPDREGGDDWWKGCIYVDAKDEPIADCDWDNLSWIGTADQTYANQFKICVGDPAPGVDIIQSPGWAREIGLYLTFPSAVWDLSKFSLTEDQYDIQGAGMIIHLSALQNKETEITIGCDNKEFVFTIYNDKGKDASAIESNTIAPKAVKLIENGQLYIILNGVRYNALGQME